MYLAFSMAAIMYLALKRLELLLVLVCRLVLWRFAYSNAYYNKISISISMY